MTSIFSRVVCAQLPLKAVFVRPSVRLTSQETRRIPKDLTSTRTSPDLILLLSSLVSDLSPVPALKSLFFAVTLGLLPSIYTVFPSLQTALPTSVSSCVLYLTATATGVGEVVILDKLPSFRVSMATYQLYSFRTEIAKSTFSDSARRGSVPEFFQPANKCRRQSQCF